jgi:UDP-N-acetylglucosamine 2-epimerase
LTKMAEPAEPAEKSGLKVVTFVGTRPELIKLARVIPLLDKYFRHVLVHTGQNYDFELNQIFFDDLGIRKPDKFLQCAGGTAMETVAKVLVCGEQCLMTEKPDAVLIYGDTNSCLVGLAAKRLKIPLYHMEAGNRCFDDRVPEEVNRRLLDHISDINMPISEHARRNLLNEGLRGDRIVKTGSMMKEILDSQESKINQSDVLKRLGLEAGRYMVLSAHREENVDRADHLQKLHRAILKITDHFKMPIVFSVHPRTRKRISDAGWSELPKSVQTMAPLGFSDYISLQKNSFCVLSDSGTLGEESGILGFPAVHWREAQERPEAIEAGAMVLCPLDPGLITIAVQIATRDRNGAARTAPPDYQNHHPSQIVVNSIFSFTHYIRRTVHHQSGE